MPEGGPPLRGGYLFYYFYARSKLPALQPLFHPHTHKLP